MISNYLTDMDTAAPNRTISAVNSESPTAFGTLGKLPLEIRSMIYGTLFVLGSIALTRASKALYADTKQSLNKHGACRVRVQQVCGRVNGFYVLRYAQDLQLNSIPRHVPTLALTLHFERICCPAARVYHEVDHLEELFGNVVDRLAKPQRCHLTLDFEDLEPKRMDPIIVRRRFDALKVLRRFQAVTVEVSYGRWINRNWSQIWLKDHIKDYNPMFAKIKDMLTPNDPLDPGPNVTIFRTIRYVAEDGWVKYLEDKEEDERIAFKLPETSDRLHHDVCYCP